jgi:hypothetical protein
MSAAVPGPPAGTARWFFPVGRLRLLLYLFPLLLAACGTSDPTVPAILLFNGRGTSPNDVAALASLLREQGLSYSTADSERLNGMHESRLKQYRLVIVPGGNFQEIGKGLATSTTWKSTGRMVLSSRAGATIAKYPDGTPAVVQGTFGNGWVILVGVHPEAPETWRRGMAFTTPASRSRAYAATLIDAALNRKPLPAFAKATAGRPHT